MQKTSLVKKASTPVEKVSQYGTSYMVKLTMENGDSGLTFIKDKNMANDLYNKNIVYLIDTDLRGSKIKVIGYASGGATQPNNQNNNNNTEKPSEYFELNTRDRSIINQVALKAAVEIYNTLLSKDLVDAKSDDDIVRGIDKLRLKIYKDILSKDPGYEMIIEQIQELKIEPQ